jgi:MarR family transcriptional regulator, lower aerobic nicotinate degradation pathway regulator
MPPARRPGAVRPRLAEPPRLQDDAGYLLSRAGGMAVRAFNDALAPLGLRTRQYAVLAHIAEHGDSSQRRVAAALDLDPSTVVALVDDLERAGWAERKQDPQDRRTRLIGATPAGRKALQAAADVVAALHADLLAPLSAQERATLLALLRRIIAG